MDGIPWKECELPELPGDVPVFALEVGGCPIHDFHFPEQGICIIGSEETGITEEARRLAGASCGIVSIPQYGAKGSINVASAVAILLFEWLRDADL